MRLLRRLTDEGGIALPMALAVLFTVAALATVAARAAIVSEQPVVSRQQREARHTRSARGSSGGRVPDEPAAARRDPVCSQGRVRRRALEWSPAARRLVPASDGRSRRRRELHVPDLVPLDLDHQHRPVRGSAESRVLRDRERRSPASSRDDQRGRGAPIFPPGYAVAVRDAINMKNNADIAGHLGIERNDHDQEQPRRLRQRHPGPGKTASIGQNLTQCPGYNTNRGQRSRSTSSRWTSPRRRRTTTCG